MFRIFLKNISFTFWLLLIVFRINAQHFNEVINNSELITIQYLLKQWQHNQYIDDKGQIIEQQVQVSEKQQALLISIRNYREGNTSTDWEELYRIPLMAIDTITMNYKDSLLLFHTSGNYVRLFKGGNTFSGKTDLAKLHAQLPKVRNLSGQILRNLRYYQKTNKKPLPVTARQLVKEAVYDFIYQRKYNEYQVKKLINMQELFIPKCQICEGTRQAFRIYASEEQAGGDTTIIIKDIRFLLFTGTKDERLQSLEILVGEAVDEFYENAVYSDSEKIQMKEMLSAERKKSMALANGRKCASCDGACMIE